MPRAEPRGTTVAPGLLLILAAAAVLASGGAEASGSTSGADRARRTPDPIARSARAMHLAPTPATVIEQCRHVQARARFRLLCPRLFPRALIGWPGQPPPALGAGVVRTSPRRLVGVDIGYGAPWESDPPSRRNPHLWRNRPCCFLHFVIQRGRPAPGARPAVLGGKNGRLLPASSSSYHGPYFGNHVRFFFRERGVPYVATLHTFGAKETTALLGRLIRQLRPVPALRVPISPKRGRTIRLGNVTPREIATAPGALWILTRDKPVDPTKATPYSRAWLLRLDPDSGRVLGRISVAGYMRGLAAVASGLWVAAARPVASGGSEEGVVIRIDPSTGREVASIRTGTWPAALAPDNGGVWVVNTAPFFKRGTLVRIGTATNRLDGPPIPLGPAPSGLAVGAGAVWVGDAIEGTVRRIDPARRHTIATIRVGRQPYSLVFAAGSLWVTNSDEGTVSRIDPATNRVRATIRVGRNPYGIGAGARSLWVANLGEGTISRINAFSGRVVEAIRIGGDPLGVAAVADAVWVTRNSEGRTTQLD